MAQTRASGPIKSVVTVTLNPAVDRVIEVPGLRVGGHLKGRELVREPAGKGVNVSRALAQLGVPSVATGFLGSADMPVYEAALAGEHIQPQFLAVEGHTRENITLLDPVHHTETHVRDAGLPVSEEDIERMLKKLNLLSGPGRLVIFSGSLPPGLEPRRFREMVEVVLGASARVGLDVPGEALAELAELPAWVIKPNAEELAALAGGEMDSDAHILEAGCRLSRRIRVVIVSRGEAGGYAFVDGSALMGQVDVDPARVVSTVGCGDALLAGFVAAQIRGEDVRASYRFALAVASAAAVTAVPGRFSLEEVAGFLPRASVEAVEG